jgi:putative NADH-flavin reductase
MHRHIKSLLCLVGVSLIINCTFSLYSKYQRSEAQLDSLLADVKGIKESDSVRVIEVGGITSLGNDKKVIILPYTEIQRDTWRTASNIRWLCLAGLFLVIIFSPSLIAPQMKHKNKSA